MFLRNDSVSLMANGQNFAFKDIVEYLPVSKLFTDNTYSVSLCKQPMV